MSTIDLDFGRGPNAAVIKIDGVELHEVSSIRVEKDCHSPTKVTIVFVPAQVVIRGEAEIDTSREVKEEGALGTGKPEL